MSANNTTAGRPGAPPVIDGADDGALGGPPAPEAAEAPVRARFPYTVAAGGSITSKRGVLGPGEEVKASDLPDGQNSLDQHVAAGRVLKR